jgi:predicted ATP-binding protein involved in virulence
MNLEKAIFINRAPFEHLELDFREKGINVLTAVNGKGKTTILSHIVDAFYELARNGFDNAFEGKENKYYRVSTSLYNIDLSRPSFVYFRFNNDGKIIDYVDIRNNCTLADYEKNILLQDKIDFDKIKRGLEEENNIKYWTKLEKKEVGKVFGQNLLTYFPSYRYEAPGYLNEPYSVKLHFTKTDSFSGYLTNPIEVISDLPSLVDWFLDVLLDMKQDVKWEFKPYKNLVLPSEVKTNEQICVWDNLNQIIGCALYSKHYLDSVRLGVGKRQSGGSRVVIMNDQILICPSIFNLSSGELSLISLFGEILHQADNNKNNIQLSEITGIVLVDEVDKHLHISLQKEILPKLFNLFPNVQFIVSSHSPFLNMGLAEICTDSNKIFDLDNNGIACSALTNDLYKEVYDMMISENNRFFEKYTKIENYISTITKPIVITEGKTDIKHIFKAKEKLGITELDFDKIDYENQPDGDSNLQKMLEQLSKIKQNNIIIGIFDRDIDKTVSEIEKDGQSYKDYGNNVYAFCIPLVNDKIYSNKISIEHLYNNEDLKKENKEGRRLFLGNEFYDSGNSRDGKYQTKIGQIQNKIAVNGVIDAKVYKREDLEMKDSIALSKNDFADAVTNEEINISDESWQNFRPIFDKINTIISLQKQ